jgi:hypothetical protein
MSTAIERLKAKKVEQDISQMNTEDMDVVMGVDPAADNTVEHAKVIIAADEAKDRGSDVIIDGGTMEEEDSPIAGERPETIQLTPEQLNKALKAIVEDYTAKMATAENKIEELKLTLEMQGAKTELGKPTKSKVEVVAVMHGPMDHQAALVDLHQKKLEGKSPRFVNNRPDIRSLRRSQGYEPILDKDGNEVRYIDGVLMAMPEERFEKEMRGPKKRLREFRRKAIARKFHERGKQHGVETYGDITYDKGEP